MKTSEYFKSMVEELLSNMLFRKGTKAFSLFLWFFLPFVILMVLGWYVSDILTEKEGEEKNEKISKRN